MRTSPEAATIAGARDHWRLADEIPFDFDRRRMSVVVEDATGKRQLITKGAVEEMIDVCSTVEVGTEVLPLTDLPADQSRDRVRGGDERGMRVVGVAPGGRESLRLRPSPPERGGRRRRWHAPTHHQGRRRGDDRRMQPGRGRDQGPAAHRRTGRTDSRPRPRPQRARHARGRRGPAKRRAGSRPPRRRRAGHDAHRLPRLPRSAQGKRQGGREGARRCGCGRDGAHRRPRRRCRDSLRAGRHLRPQYAHRSRRRPAQRRRARRARRAHGALRQALPAAEPPTTSRA